MDTTTYTVTVQLSDATLLALQANNFALYGFGAVDSAPPPHVVVWFRTTTFENNLTLSWTNTYAVYTAEEQDIGGGRIVASSTYPLQPGLGQTLTVAPPAGIGALSGGGTPGTAVVLNQTGKPMTCGLALPAPAGSGGAPAPICAVPLFGNNEVVMTPATSIFLMFATEELVTGSVMERSTGPGILIPLSPSAPSQTVAYDINAGWPAGAMVYPPMTTLPVGTPGGSGMGGGGTGGSGTGGSGTGGSGSGGSGTGGSGTGGSGSGGSGTGGSGTGGGGTGGTGGSGTGGGGTGGGGTGDGGTGGGGTGGGGTGGRTGNGGTGGGGTGGGTGAGGGSDSAGGGVG